MRNIQIKQIFLQVFVLIVLSYLILHCIYGERGIVSYFRIRNQLSEKHKALNVVQIHRVKLEHSKQLFHPQSLNIDAVKEVVKKESGLIEKGERILYLRD